MTNPSSNPTSPVSGKVWSATGSSGALGLALGMLIDFVPWLRNNIPPDAVPLIPPFLASLGAFAGGWAAKHRPTAQEIIAEVTQAEVLLQTIHPATQLVPAVSFGIGETGTTATGISTQYPYTADQGSGLSKQELLDKYTLPQPTLVGESGPEAPEQNDPDVP